MLIFYQNAIRKLIFHITESYPGEELDNKSDNEADLIFEEGLYTEYK